MFQFKKFSIKHDRCAMKVGTDAVLLGSWVSVNGAKQILDVGTGCGVIALMLAQRTNEDTHIDAVEMAQDDALQARENVMHSPWPNKISIYEKSIQNFDQGKKYNLIVSNPPYFINSLLPPSRDRVRARHTDQLTFEELISNSLRLLEPQGTLALILPAKEGNDFKQMASAKGLYSKRELAFYPRKEKPQERWLFEFGFEKQDTKSESLVLFENNDQWSKEYRKLTGDFYLNE